MYTYFAASGVMNYDDDDYDDDDDKLTAPKRQDP